MKVSEKHLTVVRWVIMLILSSVCTGHAQDRSHHEMQRHHSFADIERWVELFEDPKRKEWQKPEEVVKALGLKPGEVVVDIGAATGYFTRLFAQAVGPTGEAIGLDTEPGMVEYMSRDARERSLDNYVARLVMPDDPGLQPGLADVIFICDTLHHIDDRVRYLRSLAPSLKPDGRIVIVDFYKKPLPVGPPPAMKLTKEEVLREFNEAGYRLMKSHDFLPYQYFLEFSL